MGLALGVPDEYRAAEGLAALRRLNKEYLIDFDDACYVTKDASGKIKLHQNTSLAGAGAAWGGRWGMLIGLLFFVPFLGLAVGLGLGALSGKLSDYGIDDKFGGTILQTSLPKDPEEKLQAALKQGGGEQVVQAQAMAESQTAAAGQATPETGASGTVQ